MSFMFIHISTCIKACEIINYAVKWKINVFMVVLQNSNVPDRFDVHIDSNLPLILRKQKSLFLKTRKKGRNTYNQHIISEVRYNKRNTLSEVATHQFYHAQ